MSWFFKGVALYVIVAGVGVGAHMLFKLNLDAMLTGSALMIGCLAFAYAKDKGEGE